MKWSFSSLKSFETCARKFHEVNILRKYPKEDGEAARYGTALHEAAEGYVRGTEMPPEFDFMTPVIEALMLKQGAKFTELELALTAQLKQCAFDAKDAWVRGIIDWLCIDEENGIAWLCDYKSGNNKYADKDQLDLMSLFVFEYFPAVQVVNSALIFVVKNDMVKHKRTREERAALWQRYRERVALIEQAHQTGVWQEKPSGLCKRWCEVLDCPHNGRN